MTSEQRAGQGESQLPPARRSLALVESPTQLLNVLEWAHAEPRRPGLLVLVLAPSDPRTLLQLERVAGLVTSEGLRVEMLDPRHISPGGLSAMARLAREVSRAERLVLGDPFSGIIQTVLPLARAAHVIVVDDGTATWEFSACIEGQRPLQRWRMADGRTARAARATRLLTPSDHRRLSVFTCLEGAAPFGARVVENRYSWTRSHGTPVVRDGIDIVGASLVDTGVVEREAYLTAVERLAGTQGPVRYFAHRRESEDMLGAIAALPLIEVIRSDIPIEIALSHGPVARRLITFPSTAAYTLPIVLAGTGVRLEVRPVEAAWFTGSTTQHARLFVQRIAHDSSLPPVLEVA
ncbi:hypothetical protein [Jatrophihabitans sp.]|uniref:hypothetical protein n=1 Tax=Jatrophihabitans sp. TaxID=1932789 RepID=UPI0030C67341|nr:hypothetical protein [Jatrophihabitans sp.]